MKHVHVVTDGSSLRGSRFFIMTRRRTLVNFRGGMNNKSMNGFNIIVMVLSKITRYSYINATIIRTNVNNIAVKMLLEIITIVVNRRGFFLLRIITTDEKAASLYTCIALDKRNPKITRSLSRLKSPSGVRILTRRRHA